MEIDVGPFEQERFASSQTGKEEELGKAPDSCA